MQLNLLFNFKIGLAQWPHLKVIQSVGWSYIPWQLGHPPWSPAVTQTAAAENRKAWDSCDPPSAFTRANKADGCLRRPTALCCISGFFFFSPASNCSEFSPWPSFTCEKMPSERACRDVVWARVPEEGQQSVCTQKMEKMFLCFKDYWTQSFQNESVPSSRDNFH